MSCNFIAILWVLLIKIKSFLKVIFVQSYDNIGVNKDYNGYQISSTA